MGLISSEEGRVPDEKIIRNLPLYIEGDHYKVIFSDDEDEIKEARYLVTGVVSDGYKELSLQEVVNVR